MPWASQTPLHDYCCASQSKDVFPAPDAGVESGWHMEACTCAAEFVLAGLLQELFFWGGGPWGRTYDSVTHVSLAVWHGQLRFRDEAEDVEHGWEFMDLCLYFRRIHACVFLDTHL